MKWLNFLQQLGWTGATEDRDSIIQSSTKMQRKWFNTDKGAKHLWLSICCLPCLLILFQDLNVFWLAMKLKYKTLNNLTLGWISAVCRDFFFYFEWLCFPTQLQTCIFSFRFDIECIDFTVLKRKCNLTEDKLRTRPNYLSSNQKGSFLR